MPSLGDELCPACGEDTDLEFGPPHDCLRKINAWKMGEALTRTGAPFDARRLLVTPNVSFGWGLYYEADLICVTSAAYCYEVEIKISAADLRADALKKKWRRPLDPRLKRFYYAVPDYLRDDAMKTEDRFGVVRVYRRNGDTRNYAEIIRPAKDLPGHRPATPEEISCLHRLNSLRYWDLRHTGFRQSGST